MRKFLIYFSLIISCCKCNFKEYNKCQEITIRIKVIDKIKELETGESLFKVKLKIKNNTDNTIYYWIMTCSWKENWISQNGSLSLYNPECIKNFPTIRKFDSKEIKDIDGVICVKDTFNTLHGKDFKLGFVLIRKNEITNESEFDDKLDYKIKNKQDIFWSESFKVVQ